MIDIKGHRFEKTIILLYVHWYLDSPLSYRNLEKMLEKRGVEVDYSSFYRWVHKFTPHLKATFRNGKQWRAAADRLPRARNFPIMARVAEKLGLGLNKCLVQTRCVRTRWLKRLTPHAACSSLS